MRLIDADALIEELEKRIRTQRSTMEIVKDIVPMVRRQPASYDADKVIGQIKERAIEFEAFGICSDYVELTHAIGVIKRGGITNHKKIK